MRARLIRPHWLRGRPTDVRYQADLALAALRPTGWITGGVGIGPGPLVAIRVRPGTGTEALKIVRRAGVTAPVEVVEREMPIAYGGQPC